MIFSDRYEIIKSIYETKDTSVYLVRHKSLSENRILKCVSKGTFGIPTSGASTVGAAREADVLKKLRHPGIPILYDYDEDDEHIYLVEEFVQGVPLSDYLNWRDSISVEQICSFLVQLCEILEYLHKRKPFPILYQDLKPEHIFLRGERLILIDYGAALFVPRFGEAFQKYGTPGYCAPETIENGTSTIRSDIYSTGRVAKLLISHTKEKVPFYVQRLIQKACKENPNDRPRSMEEYKKDWEKAYAKASVSEKKLVPETIVVAGADRGIGTTHIALSLVVYLNSNGINSYYVDQTDSRSTQCLTENGPGFYERDQIIYHHHFKAVLNTGEAVCKIAKPNGTQVVDAGCHFSNFEGSDMVLYVVGSRPWQQQSIKLGDALPQDAILILNPTNKYVGFGMTSRLGKNLFGFPLDADPFTLSRRKKEFFRKIL